MDKDIDFKEVEERLEKLKHDDPEKYLETLKDLRQTFSEIKQLIQK